MSNANEIVTTSAAEATSAPIEATSAPAEATSAPVEATSAPVEATTDSAKVTPIVTTENTYYCPCETCEVCLAANETSAVEIDDGFGKIDVQPMNFVNNLGYMATGMVGIFVVIGVIIVATMAMNKFFSGKK